MFLKRTHPLLVPLVVASMLGVTILVGCAQSDTIGAPTEVDPILVDTVKDTVTLTEPAAAEPLPEDSALSAAAEAEVAATESSATESPSAEEIAQEASGDSTRPPGWSEATHSNTIDPNYAVVFPKNKVNHLTITITPENFAAMQADMTELFGEPGSRDENRGPSGPGGFRDFAVEKPMWVTATITFEGKSWTNVGVRYKGNSSLRNGWYRNSDKLPFKFDFDEFEDQHPEIDNQRFYGFKQLSLANNYSDNSFLRDTVTYDILEEAGLVAAETAFYQISLDHGDGPTYLGLYTMIEVVDDSVVDRYFDDNDGNIYEADGPAASLADGTFDEIATSFQKENNEDAADWSDIEALYTVLHSEQRTTEPAAWRASLEAILDVETFLEWLAISAVIQHWDTYGSQNHNYYLYHDPESDKLVWISWDHNMAMAIGGAGQGRNAGQDNSLGKESVGAEWPLIRYLLDDPVYAQRYQSYLAATARTVFKADQMAQKYESLAALVQPYAAAEIGELDFEKAIQQLIHHAYTRAASSRDLYEQKIEEQNRGIK